ncbi:MAG: DUF4340 domain-containing protein [Armatimonadetes bacterium]|nr:DUF4340 domain-containing protein [Akkermansiaceae bacterium]
MRSLIFTILLLLTASILGGLAIWQLREGSLNRILGTPHTSIGGKIYPELQPESVTSITLSSGETIANFSKLGNIWQATTPWRDRMDPRAALAILTFANTTTAEDFIPRDKLDPALAKLSAGSVQVLLNDASGRQRAFFNLGRRTPWLNLPATENAKPIPTTYLLPLERGRKSHVYAATGDILPLFKDGFKYLRDHRPFYFNPLALEKIRLRTAQGELILGRAKPDSPWRIVKPLDLPTDPVAMKTLLEGLLNLQASKLSDRSADTLPAGEASARNSQIAITPFGGGAEIVLELLPAETPESRETRATVSDRPETLFTIPLKPEPNLTSISELPLTVNELRDPKLTNLNIASIRAIAIETATSPTILLSRDPPDSWLATIGGKAQPANEQRLYELLKSATESRAIGFETDAAPEDLSPWGLHKPILTLTFLAANSEALAISFGLDARGNLFAKRKASPGIMRLENRFLETIATRPHDWRNARLWALSRVDTTAIVRTETGSPPLELRYDFLGETWKAFQAGNEATANLDPARANFLLGILETLEVSRWLSTADETALAALEKPDLRFEVTEATVDDFGDPIGENKQTLILAPDPATRIIYGKRGNEPSPFILAPETYLKLSIPLLDE